MAKPKPRARGKKRAEAVKRLHLAPFLDPDAVLERVAPMLDPATNAPNAIQASNDNEAVYTFLSMYKDSPNTLRTYTRESERFLMWLRVERKGKHLKDLRVEDCLAYIEFLSDIPASWQSVKPRTKRRLPDGCPNSKWAPFDGKLSASTQKTARACVTSMLDWLAAARYLPINPFRLVRRASPGDHKKTPGEQREQQAVKALTAKQMGFVTQALDAYPTDTDLQKAGAERVRFLLALYYNTTMRLSEVTQHRMGDIRGTDTGNEETAYVLPVLGKGSKARSVVVNRSLIEALTRYRKFLKLHPPFPPEPGEKTPFAMDLRTRESLTGRRIHDIITRLFFEAADIAEKNGEPGAAGKLRKFTTHALRHTSISRMVDLDVPRDVRKEQAGHGKDDTAAIYEHRDDVIRHRELNKLDWARNTTEILARTQQSDRVHPVMLSREMAMAIKKGSLRALVFSPDDGIAVRDSLEISTADDADMKVVASVTYLTVDEGRVIASIVVRG